MKDLWRIHVVLGVLIVALGLETYALAVLARDYAHDTRQNARVTEALYTHVIDANKKISRVEKLVQALELQLTGSQTSFDNYVAKQKQASNIAAASAKLEALNTALKLETLEMGTQSVVVGWTDRVARLTCSFAGYEQAGSGTVFQAKSGVGVTVMTNRHVVVGNKGELTSSCRVTLPGLGKEYLISKGNNISIADGLDVALFDMPNVDKSVRDAAALTSAVCSAKAQVGIKIVVLGYPVVGSNNGITVTEGIISGYDEPQYYTTSAKVEQGNSGGAVVDISKNCFIGIPTFVQYGSLESLARILDVRNVDL